MDNAFETLGIETRLIVSEDALREAFREAGKTAHPDAGGADESFAKLRESFELLSSPSRRLKHWLELRGVVADARGSVDAALMDLFSKVGDVSGSAEQLIRKRDDTKSALGLALLEREVQACRESVEEAGRMVEAAMLHECAAFSNYENQQALDLEAAARTVRNLAFLEKWRIGLRALFSRLI